MDLKQLLSDPPLLHIDRSGMPTSWRVSNHLLLSLDNSLVEGAVTLETGAGLSTILFALRGCNHTAVVPDPDQATRITDWCIANDISTDRLRFVLEPSETALPAMVPDPLDVVLIDGAHGFPAPFIDWYYAARRLRVGGTLIIDDTQIWTGAALRDFVAAEPQWEVIGGARLEFAVVRRVADGPPGEWLDQPYVLRRSYAPASTSVPHKWIGVAAQRIRDVRSAVTLLRGGEFAALGNKLRQQR
jgi:predicted O-methyltransferase YrrM